MSLPLLPGGRFGAGGDEPWAAVLRGGAPALVLVPQDGSADEPLDVPRWAAPADAADRSALEGLAGPLLDVGCGPGRMIRAALDAGLAAVGIDTASAAVAHCRERGLPALRRDVLDRLPHEGAWGAVLLMDGNIGIGGDVAALLARCRTLLRPGGSVVAEAHPDPRRDSADVYRVRSADGLESDPFSWSQAGSAAVLRAARGFEVARSWAAGDRCFVRLRRV